MVKNLEVSFFFPIFALDIFIFNKKNHGDGSSSDHKVDADVSGKKIHIVKGRKLIVR